MFINFVNSIFFYENQSLLKAFHTYFGGDPIFDLVDFEPGTIVIYKMRKLNFAFLREFKGFVERALLPSAIFLIFTGTRP